MVPSVETIGVIVPGVDVSVGVVVPDKFRHTPLFRACTLRLRIE